MKKIFTLSALALLCFGFSGEKKAYQVFDSKGKAATYEDILNAAKGADIVMFGELHDNPIIHWLELELTKDLYDAKKDKLIQGAEMFEADDQLILNEYLAGKLSENTFKDEAKLWPNYGTDYKPLVDFAKDHKVPFIATNIPRRYANLVYKRGLGSLDSLDAEAKKFIAPLPIAYDSTVKCYADIFASAGGHGGQNLPKSQAVKDATMAYFMLQNWSPGKTFLHYNGSYHSDNHEGIVWYLLRSNPRLKIVVISSTTQDNIDTLDKDSEGKGDFIIAVPEDMTRTQQ
ncbi:MAG TPA: ChaN family lipoprotein [Bacteroidia bacterium]|nr:ChaN family lipoprotein [Bacteroidia bacterium]